MTSIRAYTSDSFKLIAEVCLVNIIKLESEFRKVYGISRVQNTYRFKHPVAIDDPLDHYRKKIAPSVKINTPLIEHITKGYGVSLLAALLSWIENTKQREVLAVSRDKLYRRRTKKKSSLYLPCKTG